MDPEQPENLERVSTRIAAAILEFCDRCEEFHADDLRRYVMKATGLLAPASADRILRDLRQRGVIDYTVVSRRGSLYRIKRESQRSLF